VVADVDDISLEFLARQQDRILAETKEVCREVADMRRQNREILRGMDTLQREVRDMEPRLEITLNARASVIEDKVEALGRTVILEIKTLLDERLAPGS
jgi:hypothetical protein